MHTSQREKFILDALGKRGFLSFKELEASIDASPATLRRDLERLDRAGALVRIRGGAEPVNKGMSSVDDEGGVPRLGGVPFHENATRHQAEKAAIGRAAAALCRPGEAVMIDGGSTTLQMCPHLGGLGLQVLTNSLHIVSALLPQQGTRILVHGGSVFREQNIILSTAEDEGIPSFHAPRLFLGAAAIGPAGLMQADIILVAAERRLIARADQIIVMVDSSKFSGPSGYSVCELAEIDTIITDSGIADEHVRMIDNAGIELIRCDVG